jgi:hypothetical protein
MTIEQRFRRIKQGVVVQQSPAELQSETAGDGQFTRTGPPVDMYYEGYGAYPAPDYAATVQENCRR